MNADESELAKFASRAAQWWDPAGPFRTLHEINDLRLDYIARRVPLEGSHVLDVGCGGGLLSEGLAERGARMLGIDLAQENVEAARAHAREGELDIEYRTVDLATVVAEQRGGFDVVACLEMLEHVPQPAGIVAECAAALRPGGTAFFSTLNRNTKSFLLAIVAAEYALGLLPRGTHEYSKLIRPSELAGWCRSAGLDVREVTGLHLNPVTQSYWLGGNVDVNYLVYATKPGGG